MEYNFKIIIIALLFMFDSVSVIQFWIWFIHLDKTKQIKIKGIMDK